MRVIRSLLMSGVVITLLASPVFAAKFRTIPQMKSVAARELAKVANSLAHDDKNFGDDGGILAFSFTRKEGEADLNTLKQLNHIHGDLTSDDSGAVLMQEQSPGALAMYLMDDFSNTENEEALKNAIQDLKAAFAKVKKDKNLVIYGTNHADEDGSRHIIDILDIKNHQILYLQMGYIGT